jgi:hypothetical protein
MFSIYQDTDGDGYGTLSSEQQSCTIPSGWVTSYGDCAPSNPSVRPGATEVCGNGVDDDCDGAIDEGCPD